MKKIIALCLALCLAFGVVGCSLQTGDSNQNPPQNQGGTGTPGGDAPTEFHIGICTGTVAQSEDELRGAEAFIAEYGLVEDGGIVRHVTYPDNFMNEQETTIAQIASFADDPLIKAVVVNQSVPGTVAAFKKIVESAGGKYQ